MAIVVTKWSHNFVVEYPSFPLDRIQLSSLSLGLPVILRHSELHMPIVSIQYLWTMHTEKEKKIST